ncbi:MAG: ABC transporter substrate-binding protein [Acetobacteraceae bacterium]|nr:ABC transporter substrate-binding protein [Acetobacteraceae bacterium]
MMLTRRTLFMLTGTASLTAAALPSGLALAQASPSSGFVQSVGRQLVGIVNGPGTQADKRHRLQQVINASVDVDGVARFSLGRFWSLATPDQQREYVALFHDVLLNNITAKIGDYQGVGFEMGRTQRREDFDVVSTTVRRPSNPPTAVDWIISNASGSPRIVDVVAEGTSLRLTQRQDYASFLAHNNNNVQALIQAMRQQVAQSG